MAVLLAGAAVSFVPAPELPEVPVVLRPVRVLPTKDQVARREYVSKMVRRYRRYGLDRDLATLIYKVAKEERVPLRLAFQVIAIESQFYPKARSPVGARGLVQMMPSTARVLRPGTKASELFLPALNLHLGFTHLRDLLDYYDGNTNLALTAYNRGSANVDRALAAGTNPYNGYHQKVLRN